MTITSCSLQYPRNGAVSVDFFFFVDKRLFSQGDPQIGMGLQEWWGNQVRRVAFHSCHTWFVIRSVGFLQGFQNGYDYQGIPVRQLAPGQTFG